jgi:predicted nucleic acid-binding protein
MVLNLIKIYIYHTHYRSSSLRSLVKKLVMSQIMGSLIAASAMHYGLIIVTENVKDFELIGVPVVNPWDTAG